MTAEAGVAHALAAVADTLACASVRASHGVVAVFTIKSGVAEALSVAADSVSAAIVGAGHDLRAVLAFVSGEASTTTAETVATITAVVRARNGHCAVGTIETRLAMTHSSIAEALAGASLRTLKRI